MLDLPCCLLNKYCQTQVNSKLQWLRSPTVCITPCLRKCNYLGKGKKTGGGQFNIGINILLQSPLITHSLLLNNDGKVFIEVHCSLTLTERLVKCICLSFENCLLCFWAMLKNQAYNAFEQCSKIKLMLKITFTKSNYAWELTVLLEYLAFPDCSIRVSWSFCIKMQIMS